MNWQIEATEPTTPSDVRGVLERARDEWIATTPQASDESVREATDAITRVHNEARAAVVAMRNHLVREHSKSLDETHSAVLRQMNTAIEAACAVAVSLGSSPVRVTLAGHYWPRNHGGVDERFAVLVDHALLD